MVKFHQLVQEISWVQESVASTLTPLPTQTPTPETNVTLTFGGGTQISQTVLMLQSGHKYVVEMSIFSVQRAITPEVCNPELLFLCSALLLMVLNVCVKFHENILNGFEVTEQTIVCGKN